MFNDTLQEVFHTRIEGTLTTSPGVPAVRWNQDLHFGRDSDTPLDPFDLQARYDFTVALAEAVWTWFEGYVLVSLSDQMFISNVRAKMIAPLDGQFGVYAASASGSEAAAVDEFDDALVIRKMSLVAGKRHQGRCYLPGIPDDIVQNGFADTTFCTQIRAAYQEQLIDTPLSVGGTPVRLGVWSKTEYAEASDMQASFAEVANILVDRIVRKQTRRDWKFNAIVGN